MKQKEKAAAMIQTFDAETLAAAVRGEIDLNELAKKDLAGRGLDENAKWVGFNKAKEIHNIS